MNWTSVPFLPHPHRPGMLGRESKDYTEYSDWKDVTGNKTPAPEKSGHMLFGLRSIQFSRWVPASGMVIVPRHEYQHPKTTVPANTRRRRSQPALILSRFLYSPRISLRFSRADQLGLPRSKEGAMSTIETRLIRMVRRV